MAQAARDKTKPPEEQGTGPRAVPAEEPPPAAAGHPICTVALCPICAVVTTVGQFRPDALQHLLAAGREFLLATKAILDARAEDLSGDGGEDEVRFEKIEIA
jgi:hypothetical protein